MPPPARQTFTMTSLVLVEIQDQDRAKRRISGPKIETLLKKFSVFCKKENIAPQPGTTCDEPGFHSAYYSPIHAMRIREWFHQEGIEEQT